MFRLICYNGSMLIRQSNLLLNPKRLNFSVGIIVLCFSALILRIVYLGYLSSMIIKNNQNYLEENVLRGEILDAKGEILALNIPTFSVYVNPKLIIDAKESARSIVNYFKDLDYNKILKKLNKNKTFVWIKRHITPQQKEGLLQQGIPGLFFKKDSRRIYTQENLLKFILGTTDIDNQGLSGIEKSLNTELKEGKNIILSVDMRVQYAVEQELSRAIEKFGARGGLCMVMDCKTGKIISIVSKPDNKAILCGELGSVIKAFTISCALDSGKANFNTMLDATKSISIGKFKINDFKGKNTILTLAEVLVFSSNLGTAKLVVNYIGMDLFKDFFLKMNFFNNIKTEMAEDFFTIPPKRWSEATLISSSFGYAFAITPMHLISAFNCLINGGVYIYPSILKYAPLKTKKLINQNTSRQITQLMRCVILESQNNALLNLSGLGIFGKSGTALIVDRGKYQDRVRTTFIGGFPANNPQYSVLVMLDSPQGLPQTHGYRTAAWNSGPTGAIIIQRIAYLLDVMPINEEEYDKHLPKIRFGCRKYA